MNCFDGTQERSDRSQLLREGVQGIKAVLTRSMRPSNF